MLAFSPGLAQGCFELLEIVSRSSLTFPQIHASFAYFGSLPTAKIVATAQVIGWLRANDEGIASISPSGARLISLVGYQPMLRQALLDYIDTERPPWVQNATYGRSRVIRFAGRELAQVFVEAGLASSTDDEIVAFWDSMAALARGQKNGRLLEIGRLGERLSIAHELARTGRPPKWIAIDNNEDGYDVLSVVDSEDLRPLSIEVKTSTLGIAGSMHLTRNEWGRAQEVENHLFHVWSMKLNEPALAILTPEVLQGHIPLNAGQGSWEMVEVPLEAFRDRFLQYNLLKSE
ncbi:DUF3883 domain-containing protein [Janthinobacterium sp. SUN176]|uniref:DUF3883 domain-containing protein n=1 Tax=Janthinobacterium sp. SUN176 TaxID=3014788 RepID=UPI002712F58F|nr:DUF3883 domain-containing protein [Janthinobacterium sp. SUN176]MDO8074830.1 DUF3883 domain-containing protein [Janthinobacterium sp. SUN176]